MLPFIFKLVNIFKSPAPLTKHVTTGVYLEVRQSDRECGIVGIISCNEWTSCLKFHRLPASLFDLELDGCLT